MRDGQSPKDILEKYRDSWVFLCTLTGWYGDKTQDEVRQIKDLLAFTGKPNYSGEWFDVDYSCPVCSDGRLIPTSKDDLFFSGCLGCRAEISNHNQSKANIKGV
ncbi:hypothetical protein D3C86_1781480 [compost metagenome]